ncbi:MAG: hypothetical protein VW226_11985 [Rhodospirillaceae bacterium]|jgi:hypothetical protein
MDLETGLVVAALVWGGWVLVKIHRRRKTYGDPTAGVVQRQEKPKNREMPRLGSPGTVTFNQIQALQRNNFQPDKNWSKEEAALILDGVKYLRCICRDISKSDPDDGPPPLEIQNELLRVILTEQDIRDHVRKWGEERRASGFSEFDDDEPDLDKNRQYERVKQAAEKFFIAQTGEQDGG